MWEESQAKLLKRFGWETWIRTRIARSRIWSPTVGRSPTRCGGKRVVAQSGKIMQLRLCTSNLVGIPETVNPLAAANRTPLVLPVRCSCRISLCRLAFKNGHHLALANHVFVTSPRDAIGANFCFNDTATTEIYTLSLHDALPQ